MTKEEFKQFFHEEFVRHGFQKRRSVYYRKSSHDLLCGLYLQGGYDDYYINCDYFIGKFDNRKAYPGQYDFDLYGRPICVLSKDTFQGKTFMDAMIDYSRYDPEELKPWFDKAFTERILPPLEKGKQELLAHFDEWTTPLVGEKTRESVLKKLEE